MAIIAKTILTTKYGKFVFSLHKDEVSSEKCLTLAVYKNKKTEPLIRVQSSCIFSETFGSNSCDCALQLRESMRIIQKSGYGVIVYLFQEGRGIGLEGKIKSYEYERVNKADTVQAFIEQGYKPDERNYNMAILALKDLEISPSIKLITNNPKKRDLLQEGGFKVEELVKLDILTNKRTKKYLKVKKEKLGHEIVGNID